MTVLTSVPSNLRKPGDYHEFRRVASGQALVTTPRRVVILAEASSAATATPEVPVRVFDETDADTKCGKGSFAALMARVALAQNILSSSPPATGGHVEVWVCPTIAPSGGAATVTTIVPTGTAAESKDLILKIAGRLITIGVSSGDAQNTIAAAIEAKLDENVAILPVTAGVSTNTVTCTNVTKGVNGNDVAFETVQKPAGVTITITQTVAGTGAAPLTNPLAALYDQRYHGICLNNHVTGEAAAILVDLAARWGYAQKNYAWAFLGERGSLGTATTLAAAYNDYRGVVVNAEQIPNLPGELAVAVAVAYLSRENPNANLDGERLALSPPSATYAYTNAEIESALNAGVTPLTPDGSFVKIERLVTTQITLNGAAFEPLRDIQASGTDAFMAEQISIGFLTGFRQEVITDDPEDDLLGRVRDMIIEKHRGAQKARILRNVDDFIDLIKVEVAGSPAGRLIATDPYRMAGPLHQGIFVHTQYQ